MWSNSEVIFQVHWVPRSNCASYSKYIGRLRGITLEDHSYYRLSRMCYSLLQTLKAKVGRLSRSIWRRDRRLEDSYMVYLKERPSTRRLLYGLFEGETVDSKTLKVDLRRESTPSKTLNRLSLLVGRPATVGRRRDKSVESLWRCRLSPSSRPWESSSRLSLLQIDLERRLRVFESDCGVASVSRIDKNIGLFCKRAL